MLTVGADNLRWRRLFFDWIEQARADFHNLATKPGVDRSLEFIAKGLGEDAARAAGATLGKQVAAASNSGQLGLGSSTGFLSVSPRRPAPRHTFHGGDAVPRVP